MKIFNVISSFAFITTTVIAQDIPIEIASDLISLLTEEKHLRAQLEDEVNALENALMNIKSATQNSTCGCPTSTAHILFSAVLSQDMSTIGKQQTIIFDKVTINHGNGYDVRHGIFTAPVNGVYEFTIALLMVAGKTTGIEIVQNSESKAQVQTGDNGYYTMGTNVVLLELKMGDEVWVRHIDQSDSNYVNGESHTSFTGYLING